MNSNSHTPPPPGIGYRLIQGMTWPMMKLLGLSCRSYADLCSARLDRTLTPGEFLRFRFHGMMCHVCRSLPKQMEHLRTLTRCAACEDFSHSNGTTPSSDALDPESLQRIRQALEQRDQVDPE